MSSKRKTTALARRRPTAIARPKLEQLQAAVVSRVDDELAIGALGLSRVRISKQEELELAKPVIEADVLIKPTGQPYLPHAKYTAWLNRAFGRGQWALVPASQPKLNGTSVVQPYVLHVHGQPAAFAMGEQEYHGGAGGNREQTYGDALEATVASGLRRCAKRLGIGLELWDRVWLDNWIAKWAIKVRVKSKDRKTGDLRNRIQWRRKDAPPFYNEVAAVGVGEADEPHVEYDEPQRAENARAWSRPAGGHDGKDGQKISDAQVRRFHVFVTNSGRSNEQVETWLENVYGIKSSKDITRGDYDRICQLVAAPGHLPDSK